MIVWDLEGQEFPKPVASYIGDPTQLERLSPEMNQAANDFFQRFADHHLKTGVCIRCNEIVYRQNRPGLGQKLYTDDGALLAGLDRKMTYAHDRWRCTLSYFDFQW
jgi:hypothetical protein